jgi:hypothetical protein
MVAPHRIPVRPIRRAEERWSDQTDLILALSAPITNVVADFGDKTAAILLRGDADKPIASRASWGVICDDQP